jgi:hypothetical protein
VRCSFYHTHLRRIFCFHLPRKAADDNAYGLEACTVPGSTYTSCSPSITVAYSKQIRVVYLLAIFFIFLRPWDHRPQGVILSWVRARRSHVAGQLRRLFKSGKYSNRSVLSHGSEDLVSTVRYGSTTTAGITSAKFLFRN